MSVVYTLLKAVSLTVIHLEVFKLPFKRLRPHWENDVSSVQVFCKIYKLSNRSYQEVKVCSILFYYSSDKKDSNYILSSNSDIHTLIWAPLVCCHFNFVSMSVLI